MDTNLKIRIRIKASLIILIISTLALTVASLSPIFNPFQKTEAEFGIGKASKELGKELVIVQGNTLLPISNPSNPAKTFRKIPVIVTAYSSTPWQTDETPYITAAGTRVHQGIVANNLLPFGTKIRIPEIYGDKVFTVEDRMNWRKGYYHIDIWFPSYWEAKNFGAKRTYIEI